MVTGGEGKTEEMKNESDSEGLSHHQSITDLGQSQKTP